MQTANNTVTTTVTGQANANGNVVQRLATMRPFTAADWARPKTTRIAW